MRVAALVVEAVIHDIIRAERHHQRQAVAVGEGNRAAIADQCAPAVGGPQLRLILLAVRQCAGKHQPPGNRCRSGGVAVRELDVSRVCARHTGAQPYDEHLVRRTAKHLPVIGNAVAGVVHRGHASAEIQRPLVAGVAGLAGQIDEQVAEKLIGPKVPRGARVVTSRHIRIPGPQTGFVQHDALGGHLAGNDGTQAAIADEQAFRHIHGSGRIVPEQRIAAACDLRDQNESCGNGAQLPQPNASRRGRKGADKR